MVHQTNYLHRKTSLFLRSSIHLVLPSLKIQRRIIETKYATSLFTLSEKIRLSNLQKQQLQKTFLSSVYVIVITCFNKSFSSHVITGRHCFLQKFIDSLVSFQPLMFFETSNLKEVFVSPQQEYNVTTKFKSYKMKLSYIILAKFSVLLLIFDVPLFSL